MEEMKIGADPGAVEMSGVTHSCPYCGGEGRIPDGVYNFLGDGLSVLRSVTPTEAKRLLEALRRFRTGDASEDDVAEAAPVEAQEFIRGALIRDWRTWIPIVLSILLFVAGEWRSDRGKTELISEIERLGAIINEQQTEDREEQRRLQVTVAQALAAMKEPRGGKVSGRATPPETDLRPPERLPNKKGLCWCGSGRRFARCHRREVAAPANP